MLTNACRLGDFASVPLNRMVVRFESPDGRGALQVILPDRRHLLVDRRDLARPGETYYFRDATFPTCQVWVENPCGPAPPHATGTSLPPPDPKAVQRKRCSKAGNSRSNSPGGVRRRSSDSPIASVAIFIDIAASLLMYMCRANFW